MQKIGNITSTADVNGEWTNGNVAAGTPPTILDAAWFNTIQRELANVVTGSGSALDPTNDSQVLTALKFLVKGGVTGVVCEARNARMSVLTASTTAAFTADEIIVGAVLGGAQYRVGNFNKTINIGMTGAGGMDTGTAPATGYLGVYAILNPTTGASALLAVDATSVKVPEIYGGTNMPSGYTASALVAVWPVAAGNFVIGNMYERKVDIASRILLSSTVTNASRMSLATIQFPLNAKFIYGGLSMTNTSSSTQGLTIWGVASSIGGMAITATISASGSASSTFSKISVTEQTIGWSSTSTNGFPTFNIGICAYEF